MHSPGSRKTRRWLIGLLILIVVLGGGWWYWSSKSRPAATADTGKAPAHGSRPGSNPMRPNFGPRAEVTPVRVATVTLGDFPLYYKALGTVTAVNTVNVRTRVAGELVKVGFKEGQAVKAGELLAQIDPRSYRIAL